MFPRGTKESFVLLNSFLNLKFFIVKQQKSETSFFQKGVFRQLLFNNFNIYLLNVLRVPQTHAIPVFVDFNMNVYIGKHERLYR